MTTTPEEELEQRDDSFELQLGEAEKLETPLQEYSCSSGSAEDRVMGVYYRSPTDEALCCEPQRHT